MTIRDQQAATNAANNEQWRAAANAFDVAHAADVAALAASNAAFAVYNQVAWKTLDHSGASDEEIIDAKQKKIAYEKLRAAYDAAFAATAAASAVRNAAWQALNAGVQACLTNPDEIENVAGGTIIGGQTGIMAPITNSPVVVR